MNNRMLECIETQVLNQELISASLSGPLTKESVTKILIRPLNIKNQFVYQITKYTNEQAFHHNLIPQDCAQFLKVEFDHFKQAIIHTVHQDFHLLRNKKGQLTIIKKAPTKKLNLVSHNREKNYILSENQPIPFLQHVGIMNKVGQVYPHKRDKFRQINRFLEMIQDVLPNLNKNKTLTIIDFGCGKAYLTFAIYYYLVNIHHFDVNMIGLNLKKEVIQECNQLAKQLKYDKHLKFLLGDINSFEQNEEVDLMVSLHACDTATDAAIEKAVRWNTHVILCVPCCQHELYSQVKQDALSPLLKHGILKERFASLVTDAARAEILELMGYQTQIIEFIDSEHTPKNLLIRAVKNKKLQIDQTSIHKEYQKFKNLLQINPSLEKRFYKELIN